MKQSTDGEVFRRDLTAEVEHLVIELVITKGMFSQEEVKPSRNWTQSPCHFVRKNKSSLQCCCRFVVKSHQETTLRSASWWTWQLASGGTVSCCPGDGWAETVWPSLERHFFQALL